MNENRCNGCKHPNSEYCGSCGLEGKPKSEDWRERLWEILSAPWSDTKTVHFDDTVHMGHGYDWDGWQNNREELHFPTRSFVIWPSFGRWNIYDTADGGFWHEKFDSKLNAKQKVLEVLCGEVIATELARAREEERAKVHGQYKPLVVEAACHVFIVTYAKGEYEDYRTGNLRAFTTKEQAEIYRAKAQESAARLRERQAKYVESLEAWNEGDGPELIPDGTPEDEALSPYDAHDVSYGIEEMTVHKYALAKLEEGE